MNQFNSFQFEMYFSKKFEKISEDESEIEIHN